MSGASLAHSTAPVRPSIWSRLKGPAVVALVLVNVVWFGGNSAYDLWQTFSPGHTFQGVIVGHERVVTKGEDSQQYLLVTIASQRGSLRFDVPEHTFNDTSPGQKVSGEIDRGGVLGHDEALRSLTADGKHVYQSRPAARAIGEGFILLVLAGLTAAVFAWTLGARHRAAASAVATTARQE
jgi:hypothetical protein